MPDFTVTVSSDDAKIIQHLANRTGVTSRELVERNISNWAEGQIEGFFIQKIKERQCHKNRHTVQHMEQHANSRNKSGAYRMPASVFSGNPMMS